jgi:hyperosmotically inducible protein
MKTHVATVCAISALWVGGCAGSEPSAHDPSSPAATTMVASDNEPSPASPNGPANARPSRAPGATSPTPATGSAGSAGAATSPSSPDAGSPEGLASRQAIDMDEAPAAPAAPAAPDADDTGTNARDRAAARTPTDQGTSDSDRHITAAIRRAIVADRTLSFTAKNVKIITIGGQVTLRGPVANIAEKAAVDAYARRASGVSGVDDELDVK